MKYPAELLGITRLWSTTMPLATFALTFIEVVRLLRITQLALDVQFYGQPPKLPGRQATPLSDGVSRGPLKWSAERRMSE